MKSVFFPVRLVFLTRGIPSVLGISFSFYIDYVATALAKPRFFTGGFQGRSDAKNERRKEASLR